MISPLAKLCVTMEMMMPELAKLGIQFREYNGQTLFHEYQPSGEISTTPIFYIGRLGANVADEEQWTKFCVPDDSMV
jgi:hypothetical protein